MQIGGLGSSHNSSDHHVTNCIHDHHEVREKTGMTAMKTSAAMEASAAKAELQQESLLSLSTWLRNMLGSGKGFLLNFWDGGQGSADSAAGEQTAVSSAEGSRAAASQAAVQTGDPDTAAAAVTVQQPALHNSSHLSAAEGTEPPRRTFLQKISERLPHVSGRLNGRRSRKDFGFQTKNSFQARQERSREDLRKHSRYRKDTVEINCARTEESYLMDSYDRRGEYSRLTTKNEKTAIYGRHY